MIRRSLFLFACIALSACTTAPTGQTNQPADGQRRNANNTAVSSTQNLRTGLPSQRLEAGDCGLFLWSQTEITRLVFFARASERSAAIFIEGQEKALNLTAARGDIFGQFLTDLAYATVDEGRAISVTYTPGEELEGGARISGGRISYLDNEGWTRVLPVLGVRACQPLISQQP